MSSDSKLVLGCLLVSSLLRVGDHLVHQQCHYSVSPVLDVICPSSPRLSRLLLLSSLPSSILVHRFLALITGPKYWSLRRCTVVSRRFCGCTSCSTDALARCAIQLTLSNRMVLMYRLVFICLYVCIAL